LCSANDLAEADSVPADRPDVDLCEILHPIFRELAFHALR
jgi:hypothetical protein